MEHGDGRKWGFIFKHQQAIIGHIRKPIQNGQRQTIVVIIFVLMVIGHPLVLSENA